MVFWQKFDPLQFEFEFDGIMTAKKKLTDKEIRLRLIEDAKDPDAWGKPTRVPASRAPRPEWYGQKHLELAAKSYVLSVLHRLGAE